MKTTVLFWVIAAVGMAGCGKSDPGSTSASSWTSGFSVYFVGNDHGRAAYWKNGVETALDSGGANGIAINGPDVYIGGAVTGSTDTGQSIRAAYWKDGMVTRLTNSGMAWAHQPVVVGGDVYVPGFIESGTGPAPLFDPVYWKNGLRVEVAPDVQAEAVGMAVDGADVYVIGDINGPSSDTAVVWKNGQRLPGTTMVNTGGYRQILISGGNLYVVGLRGYFVNTTNQYVEMPGAGVAGAAISLFLNGPDVYVAGGMDSSGLSWPAYWKNGVPVRLPGFPGATLGIARGIVVAGSDVYVAGTLGGQGSGSAVYWKNGVMRMLTNGGAVFGAAVGQ